VRFFPLLDDCDCFSRHDCCLLISFFFCIGFLVRDAL
jgi:hypothetical protein